MDIGRRLFYEKDTGKIIKDTFERSGDVIEKTFLEDFPSYDESIHGVIEFPYGHRKSEFANKGSYRIDLSNLEVVIYPKVRILSDKEEILTDNTDTAIVSANVQDDCIVTFNVFGTDYQVQSVNGVATLEVSTSVTGDIQVTATTNLYGTNSIIIKGVDTVA